MLKHTSIFNAVFEIEYEQHFFPASKPILANPVVIFKMTFRLPFSNSARNDCVINAGATTLCWKASSNLLEVTLNAVSSPGF